MKWKQGKHAIEMLDEADYVFASSDKPRSYDKELLLAQLDSVTSRHGLVSFAAGKRVASLVVGSAGGDTSVHEQSLVLADGLCFAAVGPELLCLTVPELEVRWHQQADPATCFALYLSPGERAVVVHGEQEISKWSFEGQRLWSFGGAEFTGELSIVGKKVVVEDYEGRVYRIDLGTGHGKQASA